MEFEWDDDKNAANVRKHGISFEDAIQIFKDFVLSHTQEDHETGEIREVSTGVTPSLNVLVVVHTDRNSVTRLISARRANARERSAYFGHYPKTSQ